MTRPSSLPRDKAETFSTSGHFTREEGEELSTPTKHGNS